MNDIWHKWFANQNEVTQQVVFQILSKRRLYVSDEAMRLRKMWRILRA